MSGLTPCFSAAALIIPTRHLFEFIASLPPRRITVLPALRQRHPASTVTLGRDSKIMPITPSGTDFFITVRPLGKVFPPRIFPTGSGNAATCLTPSAIPSILASVRVRRSTIEAAILFSCAAVISSSFAFFISSLPFSSITAIVASISFLSDCDSIAELFAADFAFFPSSSM